VRVRGGADVAGEQEMKMSARFELEAMRIACEEMLARIDRIEKEIFGECREAAPDGSTVDETSTVSGFPSGAAVS